MTPITLPYHLLIATLVGFTIAIFLFLKSKKTLFNKYDSSLWVSGIVFWVVYTLIIGSALILDVYYQWNLNQFDLDKDGFFSGRELTPNQEIAMQKLINDTGRNLSIFTGLLVAGFFSSLVFISLRFWKKAKASVNNYA
jgi:hypothetical protein